MTHPFILQVSTRSFILSRVFKRVDFPQPDGPKTHGIRSKKELDEIVEKSLRQAALWDEVGDKLKKSALALSGGQQQRLCIARTLAVNPDGFEKSFSVSSNSMTSPKRKNAVLFEIRFACCIEWVTIIIV